MRADKISGLKLRHLEVYVLDYVDVILTKALSGRDKDRDAINDLKKKGIIAQRDELERRFKKVVPNIGKEKEINTRLQNFLKAYCTD